MKELNQLASGNSNSKNISVSGEFSIVVSNISELLIVIKSAASQSVKCPIMRRQLLLIVLGCGNPDTFVLEILLINSSLSVSALGSVNGCEAECESSWNVKGDRCFFFSSKTLTWVEAEKSCRRMGGPCVTPSLRKVRVHASLSRVKLSSVHPMSHQ